MHTETSILPTTVSCNTQGECTTTETKTVAVSSHTQSPTEARSRLGQKGARGSESEDDESSKCRLCM